MENFPTMEKSPTMAQQEINKIAQRDKKMHDEKIPVWAFSSTKQGIIIACR